MRRLALAGLSSIGLHSALFAALPRGALPEPETPGRERRADPEVVDVEVLAPSRPGPEAAPSAALAKPRMARPRAVRRQLALPAAELPAMPEPSAEPPASPGPAAPPIEASAEASAEASSASVALSRGNPLGAAVPAVVGPTSIGRSAFDVSPFLERLRRAAQRCVGPRPGQGKVRFCVSDDGAPTDVSLVQSTGNFALDDAALHCVIPGAAPFPRTDRCLVVPLVFR